MKVCEQWNFDSELSFSGPKGLMNFLHWYFLSFRMHN